MMMMMTMTYVHVPRNVAMGAITNKKYIFIILIICSTLT